MKRLMKKTAGYDFSYANLDKILDAMTWKGDKTEDGVSFVGSVSVDTLKNQFGLTDEDLVALPNEMEKGEIDFEVLTDDMFKDYVAVYDKKYELVDKQIDVKVSGSEFYIEGTAGIEFEEEDMNGPDEFDQRDFV